MGRTLRKDYAESDLKISDKLTVLNTYGPILNYCAGGRVVASGYICPHCTSKNPSIECNKPLPEE